MTLTVGMFRDPVPGPEVFPPIPMREEFGHWLMVLQDARAAVGKAG